MQAALARLRRPAPGQRPSSPEEHARLGRCGARSDSLSDLFTDSEEERDGAATPQPPRAEAKGGEEEEEEEGAIARVASGGTRALAGAPGPPAPRAAVALDVDPFEDVEALFTDEGSPSPPCGEEKKEDMEFAPCAPPLGHGGGDGSVIRLEVASSMSSQEQPQHSGPSPPPGELREARSSTPSSGEESETFVRPRAGRLAPPPPRGVLVSPSSSSGGGGGGGGGPPAMRPSPASSGDTASSGRLAPRAPNRPRGLGGASAAALAALLSPSASQSAASRGGARRLKRALSSSAPEEEEEEEAAEADAAEARRTTTTAAAATVLSSDSEDRGPPSPARGRRRPRRRRGHHNPFLDLAAAESGSGGSDEDAEEEGGSQAASLGSFIDDDSPSSASTPLSVSSQRPPQSRRPHMVDIYRQSLLHSPGASNPLFKHRAPGAVANRYRMAPLQGSFLQGALEGSPTALCLAAERTPGSEGGWSEPSSERARDWQRGGSGASPPLKRARRQGGRAAGDCDEEEEEDFDDFDFE